MGFPTVSPGPKSDFFIKYSFLDKTQRLKSISSCWTSEQAVKQFRTKRQGGVISLPCHLRYLKYIETSVIAGDTPEDIKLLFSKITLSNAPAFNEDGSCSKFLDQLAVHFQTFYRDVNVYTCMIQCYVSMKFWANYRSAWVHQSPPESAWIQVALCGIRQFCLRKFRHVLRWNNTLSAGSAWLRRTQADKFDWAE